jgi:hypothetical protein
MFLIVRSDKPAAVASSCCDILAACRSAATSNGNDTGHLQFDQRMTEQGRGTLPLAGAT